MSAPFASTIVLVDARMLLAVLIGLALVAGIVCVAAFRARRQRTRLAGRGRADAAPATTQLASAGHVR